VIGERGAQLSGGQRARLALARCVQGRQVVSTPRIPDCNPHMVVSRRTWRRAILRDSKVLLLDEISAALDSVSEAALHTALRRTLARRTAILIAHRWSSIQVRCAMRWICLGTGRRENDTR
jgi:ABC-type multidrug transport system fused ATPase/permease subunit